MRTPRFRHAAAELGGRILVIGGTTDGNDAVSTVEEYDPMSDTWRTRAPIPGPRRDLQAVVHQGQVWVFGGNDGTRLVSGCLIYDATTNSWSSGPPMGSTFDKHVVVSGQPYIFIFEQRRVVWGPGAAGSQTPAPNHFAVTSGGQLDFAASPAGIDLGGFAYMIGGERNGNATSEVIATDVRGTAIMYGRVEQKASLRFARSNLAAAVVGGRIYAIGGNDANGIPTTIVEELIP
jgi:N-acetylneuraminic acid mutarotase